MIWIVCCKYIFKPNIGRLYLLVDNLVAQLNFTFDLIFIIYSWATGTMYGIHIYLPAVGRYILNQLKNSQSSNDKFRSYLEFMGTYIISRYLLYLSFRLADKISDDHHDDDNLWFFLFFFEHSESSLSIKNIPLYLFSSQNNTH